MRKIITLALLVVSSLSVKAQFYTIKPSQTYLKIGGVNPRQEIITEDLENEQPVSTKEENLLAKADFTNTKLRMYLSLPIDTIVITSSYGNRMHPLEKTYKFHKGVDLRARNNYIYSVMPGQIIKVGRDKKLGLFVVVDHGDFKTTYGHLNEYLVKKDTHVNAGDIIGVSGSTGNSTGEHLHFQISFKDQVIDPHPILNYIQEIKLLSNQELQVLGI